MPYPKRDCKYLLICKIFVDKHAIQILHSVVALYLCKCWNFILSCLFVFTFIFCWSLPVDIWSSDLAEQPSTDGADLSAMVQILHCTYNNCIVNKRVILPNIRTNLYHKYFEEKTNTEKFSMFLMTNTDLWELTWADQFLAQAVIAQFASPIQEKVEGRSTTDRALSTLEVAWSAQLNMEMTLRQSTGVSLVTADTSEF